MNWKLVRWSLGVFVFWGALCLIQGHPFWHQFVMAGFSPLGAMIWLRIFTGTWTGMGRA